MFDRRVSCDDPSGTEVRISYTSFLFTGWGRRVDLVVRYKSKESGAIGNIGKAKSSMETSKSWKIGTGVVLPLGPCSCSNFLSVFWVYNTQKSMCIRCPDDFEQIGKGASNAVIYWPHHFDQITSLCAQMIISQFYSHLTIGSQCRSDSLLLVMNLPCS